MAGSSCDAVLVIVCGLPAAGKTTLARRLVASGVTSPRLYYERISFDDLYEQRDGGDAENEFDPVKWKACQQEMVMRVTKHLEEENSSARDMETELQLVLLVDDNFQYRSLRKRFFQLATEQNCGFALLYVDTPVSTCRERNAGRSDSARVPYEVFERMVTAFEPPNAHQNSWETNTCTLSETDDDLHNKEVMGMLVQQAEQELKGRRCFQRDRQREEAQQLRDRLATQRNVLHLVDLQLRQWISTQLREPALPPGMTKAQLASRLNQRRKDYLASIKHSDFADVRQGDTIDHAVVSLVLRFQEQQE